MKKGKDVKFTKWNAGATALFLLAFLAVGISAGLSNIGVASAATLSRTPWQQFTPATLVSPCYAAYHGDIDLYSCAPAVPAANAAGWGAAPDPEIINFHSASRLGDCFESADFNFFQTFVNVPANVAVTTFTISFRDTDDGARASIFNSAYPGGLVVSDSYVYLGGTQTTGDLASYLVAGELNRIVVTQVDDCAVLNNLGYAAIELNGNTVEVVTPFGLLGFFQPVKFNGDEGLNSAKAGQTIPLKFRVTDSDGNVVSDTGIVQPPIQSKPIVCPDAETPVGAIEVTTASGASQLRFDSTAQQFVYDWATVKDWAGSCREVIVTLTNGQTLTADFQFK